MKRFKSVSAACFLTLLAAGTLIYSRQASEAVTDSIERCIGTVIPSLFAFMVISKLIIGSGAAELISKPFDRLFSLLLCLPKGTASLFLISNSAGYPVGVSMLGDMIHSGETDKRSAEAMSIYCYSAGPAFIINAVGIGVYNNRRIGYVILLSVLTTNLILAAVVNRLYRPSVIASNQRQNSVLSSLLVNSVTDAGEALLMMCLIIVFFSVITALLEAVGVLAAVKQLFSLGDTGLTILRSSLEVTRLTDLSPNAVGSISAAAAVIGSGGACVLMQIKALIAGKFQLKLFLKWLPVRIILNYLLAELYAWLILDNSLPAFSGEKHIIVEIDNFVPSLCLIMMIFLLVFKKRVDFFKRV